MKMCRTPYKLCNEDKCGESCGFYFFKHALSYRAPWYVERRCSRVVLHNGIRIDHTMVSLAQQWHSISCEERTRMNSRRRNTRLSHTSRAASRKGATG